MSLRGFFEFSCWPGCVSSMGNWFGKANRGFMMSLWVGCKNFGDMSGFLIVGSLILH
jgi:sugar phosphate permease